MRDAGCVGSWKRALAAALTLGAGFFFGVLTGVGSMASVTVVEDDERGCRCELEGAGSLECEVWVSGERGEMTWTRRVDLLLGVNCGE